MLRINHMPLLLIFASFHYGLPSHHFLVTFSFTCTSAGSRTHHFTHHQFAHLQTYLHFTNLIQKLANGAPTLHQFFYDNAVLPGARISHWGTRFCICTSFSKKLFIIYYLLYKHFLPSVNTFFVLTIDDFSLFGHTQPMSPLDWSSTYH